MFWPIWVLDEPGLEKVAWEVVVLGYEPFVD